ncbi:MAG TPA: amino acid adenylation domain-containing protein, partial [Pyrinomonadaceae bacterium]|nr:amino acid adenylation domain-containing protein [Pyrinomonadaceae bacterium]
RGATHSFTVPAELTSALKELSRGENCTLFMTLLAAWQALLSRYSNQEEVVVGTPIANRTQVEVEGLIGFFVNTLALRGDVSGEPSFRELLARVREVTLGAYAHQEVPFERLVEELQPERSLSHQPLFQVMFALQNAPQERLYLNEVELRPFGMRTKAAQFDLTLAAGEAQGELSLVIEYNTDLFDASTAERMASHYRKLLEDVVKDADALLPRLTLLTESERRQLLCDWNDTAREYSLEPVHHLFEAQAARRPEAVAVRHGEEQVTYAELNGRANRLARRLRELGVGPQKPVGLCVEKSINMLVGLLATLKAGSAYVPLDPTYPAERLAYMIDDAGIELLLTQPSLVEKLPAVGPQLIDVETSAPQPGEQGAGNLDVPVELEHLAYVIYTSGSTGRPKGVLIPHRSLVNYTKTAIEKFELSPADRVLQFASISFDAAAEEIFPCLTAGATLVLRDEGMLDSSQTFLRRTRDAGITVLDLPTAFWHYLTAGITSESLTLPEELRLVIIGGEEALPERLSAWRKSAGGRVRLLNTYGPTEATIVSTMCDLSASDEAEGVLPKAHIGSPVFNVRTYVLDEYLQPVPVGIPGELYIGGDGLARGYLNRPALTAERFIPNPFGGERGGRLYRTGDRVRYLHDGHLEFLGRLDQQVKIRGFRIELGEIESALRAHPAVRDAIVLAREDTPGERQLAAYFVVEPGHAEPTHGELRNSLKERLPEYMTPAAFVALDHLPLLSNGKLDRRALPAPAPQQQTEHQVEEARTPLEEIVGGIWRDVLSRQTIGIHDNFFESGGHSLLATQVVSRLREALAVDVPLKALFEYTTVAELAAHVEALLRGGEHLPLPPVKRASRDEATPLSFAQQRLWFLDKLEPGSAAYNMPTALRLTGRLDAAALGRTLGEVVRRHEVLRTTFVEVDGSPVQVIAPASEVSLPVTDLSALDAGEREAEAQRLTQQEARRPFDLAAGPLLRAALLRLSEQEHVLLVTMHHIVSDGWSTGIFIREMSALYAAFTSGEESPLEELPVQYADYAAWQRQYLSGEVLDAQLSYWRGQLGGAPALLELPTDRPRPPAQSYRGATHSFILPGELTSALRELSQREGCTLFMTLLAGWQALLSRYSNQQDVVVGTPIANRTRVETEGLIGFFVNTLALRTDLSGDPTFRELLARVREVT